MKKTVIYALVSLCILCIGVSSAYSQGTELGLSVGLSTFYGDLGGANNIGRPLFFDFEGSQVHPVISGVYRREMGKHASLKLSASYSKISADDKLIQPKYEFSPEWYRWYRNMNFKTNLMEGAAILELNVLKYQPGSKKYPVTPYIFGGVGVFHYNPKGYYNGSWIDLRPLRTEGEGMPGFRVPEYSLTNICFPLGFGFRFNLTNNWTMGIEYGDRVTLTDYIDDVSTSYIAQSDFNTFFSSNPVMAQTAWDMSVRSDELDPGDANSYITAPGQQRGDPHDKDQYIFTGVITLAYFIPSSKKGFLPHKINPKSQISCIKSWKDHRR